MNTPRRLPNDAISQFDEWAAAVFDQSSLGMIRISPDLRVVACNRTAAEIHGLSTLEGRSIVELLADQKGIEIMQRQAEQRREGLSTEYEVELLHLPDQRRVPVKVSGMPIISSTGDVVGSLAIIRSLELERRVEAFEEAIHSTKGATGIFEAVNHQIDSLLKFDFSSFSIYSKNGKHSRMLLSYDPERQVESHKRWYPISGALADWTQRHEVQVVDFTEFVRQFPEFQNDSTVKKFMNSGFVKSLRIPVVRGGRVVAAFSCASRNRDTFTDDHLTIVKALPIAKAFLMALHSLENDELSFRFDLIRDMFICRTPEQIAEAATKKLADQYGWESVEIYTVEEASRKIRLVSQSAVSPEFAIDEGYSQSIEKGILGYVCKTDQDVLIDDVTRDPQFKDLYVPLRRATLSELCMPIRVNGRISAVLNVEDKHENAFTEEEQEKLRSLLDEIGALFGAVWDKALIANAFELTPSLVLIADTAHNVIQHNAAAIARLGFSAEELTGSPIGNYFEQPEIAERLFQTPLAGIETGLRCKDGSILPVLLGSRELEGFGAWVISARDLTTQKRIAELESLRHMYREIAAQTKTPLSLACSWIQRLQRKAEESQDETSSILQKVLTQLKKVDITYERLALYSQSSAAAVSKEILLNAADLLKRTLDNFPQELLSIQGLDAMNLYVRGDPFEIEFAIESAISYLQRFLPADERVEVRLSSAADRLLIHIQGFFPPEPTGNADGEPPETVCQTIHEMALGADIIGDFMQRHGGSFRQETMTNNIVRFQLDFPLERVEA
jgi:PAS domain S-box-containing protein